MALDQRGDIAAAQIAFYVPVLVVSFILTLRHGFRREAGWVFLLTFSIVRIVGAVLLVVAEETENPKPNTGLFSAAFILISAGVAPLLLATMSFVAVVSENSIGGLPMPEKRFIRLLRVALTVGLILAIAGGTDASSSNQGTISTGNTLRKAGSIIFVVVFVILVLLHFMLWTNQHILLRHRRTLLIAISAALPFLAVRVLYSVLGAFAPLNFNPTARAAPSTGLARFSAISGDWWLFLIMDAVMEYIVVVIYIVAGTVLPLSPEKDLAPARTTGSDEYPMNRNPAYAPPQNYAAPYSGPQSGYGGRNPAYA